MMKSAVGADVPRYLEDTPAKPGLYLVLFHGREHPAELLGDWGANGPMIGPLEYVHTTYATEVKFEFESTEDHDRYFKREVASSTLNGVPLSYRIEADLAVIGDLLKYGGMYYGDWSVFVVKP